MYVSSVIVLYVDDMLWAADSIGGKLISEMLKELEVGETFFLEPGEMLSSWE